MRALNIQRKLTFDLQKHILFELRFCSCYASSFAGSVGKYICGMQCYDIWYFINQTELCYGMLHYSHKTFCMPICMSRIFGETIILFYYTPIFIILFYATFSMNVSSCIELHVQLIYYNVHGNHNTTN